MSFHSIPPLNPIETLQKLGHSTLIVPTVSVGNIPQLSTDLLIHNLNCQLIARLDDDYLYPFVSPVDYVNEPKTGISTPLELYYNEELKITVLQQRSPILPGYQNKFLTNLLIPFITSIEFANIIVLNSSEPLTDSAAAVSQNSPVSKKISFYTNSLTNRFTTINLDESRPIESVPDFRSFSSSFISTLIDLLQSAPASTEMKETPSEIDLYRHLKENFPSSLPLSRASSSIHAAQQAQASKVASVAVLCIQSYEGDNSADAVLLTGQLLRLLEIGNEKDDLKSPKSWDGFYGVREVPVGIEGLYS